MSQQRRLPPLNPRRSVFRSVFDASPPNQQYEFSDYYVIRLDNIMDETDYFNFFIKRLDHYNDPAAPQFIFEIIKDMWIQGGRYRLNTFIKQNGVTGIDMRGVARPYLEYFIAYVDNGSSDNAIETQYTLNNFCLVTRSNYGAHRFKDASITLVDAVYSFLLTLDHELNAKIAAHRREITTAMRALHLVSPNGNVGNLRENENLAQTPGLRRRGNLSALLGSIGTALQKAPSI